MKKMLIHCLLILIYSPLPSQAQMYKCKKGDAFSFQDHPCGGGAATVKVSPNSVDSGPVETARQSNDAKTSTPKQMDPGSGDSWQNKARALDYRRAEEEKRRRTAQAAADRALRCNEARQSLGVLKEQRPVFQRDNQGDRHYIEDQDRPAMIAAAQRRVAEYCR